ncbi:hypothetical protein K2173_026743 [Erythroxylum novogranatense]|uniref:Uncharacterized protein n=1 Tax=Erythroxylum novogranatense TaxID=1862640 RepID=A0AAV8TX27_9ROSI|nr:hypothetical protein K2173_026743 [Erythroxylum novogranatense]
MATRDHQLKKIPRFPLLSPLLHLQETLTEFLSKATGTAVEWVQMPGMKSVHEVLRPFARVFNCTFSKITMAIGYRSLFGSTTSTTDCIGDLSSQRNQLGPSAYCSASIESKIEQNCIPCMTSYDLHRGFNEALNGFTDEGWSMMGNDGMDDVTVLVNSSPDKLMGSNLSFTNGFVYKNGILCAKASMLLS